MSEWGLPLHGGQLMLLRPPVEVSSVEKLISHVEMYSFLILLLIDLFLIT